jgi:uncharacterized protein (DUF1778 family)
MSGSPPYSHSMPNTAHPKRKTERLEARVTPELKRTIEHAARLAGRSITDFLLESVQKSAHETIFEHEVIRLNAEQSRSLVALLLNPPKPNAKLKAAAAAYDKLVRGA